MLVYASAAATHSELVTISRQGEERTLLRMDIKAANPRRRRMAVASSSRRSAGACGSMTSNGRSVPPDRRRRDRGLPDFRARGREVIYRSGSGLFRQPLDGVRAAQIKGTGPSEFASGLSRTA
jgi:hypothetical protein